MTCERNLLPGHPSAKLIALVRSILRRKGIRPPKDSALWLATWQWAYAISLRQDASMAGIVAPALRKRCRWPRGNEVASQYVLLVLTEMRAEGDLRLHSRAMQCLTPYVAERFQQIGQAEAPKLTHLPELFPTEE
jgi:hypothetical protein